jgi:hypothetical protein
VRGWAWPRLAQQGIHVEEADPVAPAAPWPPGSLDLPSPTPMHELAGAGTAPSRAGLEPHVRAPATSDGDVLDNGAGSSTTAAPPPHRRVRIIVSRAVLESSRAGRRPGEWSPARLGLSNVHSNGVPPGTHLPGGCSSEKEDEGVPGPSASLC